MCDCQFDVDPESIDENTVDTTWHFKRICPSCATTWFGLHCPHDGVQNPCPACNRKPDIEIA
jgi:hypothetical protein